ncbi:hypothetical protein NP493_1998g00000 [Ridgeia piscesae]|uniref:Reverse transcriptase domain-containing protein n=1 Tax=Ridgeia piscesae TaxID=27915 RepID=A0AAD9JN72_RIDPI|nr:hypothetical protein NP493_1998g00000 [Ridgeia piscesae]
MKNCNLKLTADKIEFLIIGTPMQRLKLDGFFPTHILSQLIISAASVLNLGVTFDENVNLKQHISNAHRCYIYNIRDLCRIRRFRSLSVAKTISIALVSSILDYCSSLLAKVQLVNNCMARVVTFSLFFAQCRF